MKSTTTAAVLLLASLAAACGGSSEPSAETVEVGATDTVTPTPSSTGPTPTPSLVDEGARLFFQETFDGNGRTCGTCHPATARLTLPPDGIVELAALVTSAAAARGEDLFFGAAKCSVCHGGPLFTDNGFFDTGVTQRPVNLVPATECDPPCAPIGPREAGGTRAFNTPSLLGLANSAPF